MMEQLVVANLHPKRDQALEVKNFRRKHNFDKFRNELQDVI